MNEGGNKGESMRAEGIERVISRPGKGRIGIWDENKCKLQIVCWNVCGWSNCRNREDYSSRGVVGDDCRYKVAEYYQADIIIITESWLKGKDVAELTGYVWWGRNRASVDHRAMRGSGGVGIFIKEELVDLLEIGVLDDSMEDILWVDIRSRVDDEWEGLVLGICYVPPEQSSRQENVEEVFEKIGDQILKYGDLGRLILCGDFNARCGEVQEYAVKEYGISVLGEREIIDRKKNLSGEMLLNLMGDHDLCMMNGRGRVGCNDFTCVSSKGKSVVDYCLTRIDDKEMILDFEVVTMSKFADICGADVLTREPDHSLIKWAVEFPSKAVCSEVECESEAMENGEYEEVRWGYPEGKEEIYVNFMEEKCRSLNEKLEGNGDLDDVYKEFCGAIFSGLKKTVIKGGKKRKQRLRKSKAWFGRKLWRMRKEFHATERKWLRGRVERGVYIYKRNRFREEVRRAKSNFERVVCDSLDENLHGNQQGWWHQIKKLMGKESNRLDEWRRVLNDEGVVIEGKEEVKAVWTSYFEELLNKPPGERDVTEETTPKEVPLVNGISAEVMNRPLEKEEVEEALKRVREKAAPGEDGIMVGWLRNRVVGDFVFKLCSRCFESGQMPEAWQRGIILPIPKKRTRGPPDPNLYRGISLLSAVYKVFCTVMKSRVEAYVEGENLLCEEQNGFRKGRGCIDNILMMVLMGNKCVQLNGSMFSAFIDFKKAYDSVDRDLLWGKLESMGIQGKILQCIKAMYSDVKCKVKVGGEVGSNFSVTTGLRQGCVLSPLLFSLYVNDLMEVLRREEIGIRIDNLTIPGLLFADDLVITAEKSSDLNRALEVVYGWCNRWKLKINAEKCSVVHFRKKGVKRSSVEFKIGEEILSMVSEYKYLG